MCTYNRAHYIGQAIDSVLSQSFSDWELLIVDDASTDTTEEIVRSYEDSRIVYIKNESNLGITKNRNKALSLAKGEYIAVLDSDDYWIDNAKLEKQVAFLDAHPMYALVGTQMEIVDSAGKKIKKEYFPTMDFLIRILLLLKNMFAHSSVLYRRKEILNLGGYDDTLPIWEDYDLWLKIGRSYKFANLSTCATAYRTHDLQSNTNKKEIGKKALKDIQKRYKGIYFGYNLTKIVDILRTIKHGK